MNKLLIAGPCSAESREQVLQAARAVKEIGADIFRAGVWKPRTHPGCFEGIGEPALEWLAQVQETLGLEVTTEVASAHHVRLCLEKGIRTVWIGARTTTNPFMVQEIADALKGSGATVLVKNPVNPDVDLWIGAAERLASNGINDIILVHRGFSKGLAGRYRNDPKWHLLLQVRERMPQLPLICDPSHIAGERELVPEIAQRAMDLGLDGLMIECHPDPSVALSDASQQLTPASLKVLLDNLVTRVQDSSDAAYRDRLEMLRSQIDSLDADIIDNLARRMEISRQIGALKRENGISIVQPVRWGRVMQDALQRAAASGLEEELVNKIFALIHEASVRQQ
jgi:chorismate mutase